MVRKLLPLAWALLAVPAAVSVHARGDPGDRAPDWDVASHELNGLRMADAISREDPAAFLEELIIPHHYPPGPETSSGNTKEDFEYIAMIAECGRYRLVREDATTVPGVRVRVWDRTR